MNKNLWSDEEITILNTLYCCASKIEILSQILRTWNAIVLKAEHLGLKRFQTPDGQYKYCGHCKQLKKSQDFKCKNRASKANKPYVCRNCFNKAGRENYFQNREKEVERSRLKYQKLREDVFRYYGNICACCAETEFDFLTIDHITITRAEHKKMTGGNAGGIYLYYWLKKNNYPPGFQTLCMNCNFSKYKNGGECIHQLKRELADV